VLGGIFGIAAVLVLRARRQRNTLPDMKTLTIRLPDPLAAEIEAESRTRKISKSDVVRERLRLVRAPGGRAKKSLHAIADLIGSVDGLPADLSVRKKRSLKATGYGQKHPR
jgi:Arc/MetJ-type ribon-helix-helix transcriptional regulator